MRVVIHKNGMLEMSIINVIFLTNVEKCAISPKTSLLPYLACSPTLQTFQVAESFALPAATASSSPRFTVLLLAAEHFQLLALRAELSATGGYMSAPSSATFRTQLETFLFTESYPDIRLI